MSDLIVWKGRANIDKITLSKEGTVLTEIQMGNITKVELKYNDTYYSSEVYTEVFDLSTEASTGTMLVKLGLLPLEIGADDCELLVYDAATTEGVMWVQFRVVVKQDVLADS